MEGPDSSYSSLEIHICWNVDKEARMEPPIQTEYFLSGGATTLTLMVDGARAVTSKFFGTCKTFLNLLEHSGTTGQDNVLEQISTNIDIAFQAPKISFHPSSLFSPFSFHPQPLFPSSPSSHLSSRFSLFMISVVSWSVGGRWREGRCGFCSFHDQRHSSHVR